MARHPKPDTRPVAGIVLVDKPAGVTSNRVLQWTKRLFRARKAGHTGTLDPMATGMLPVCLGAATRVSGLMLAASKRYSVTARFGTATNTGDATGEVIEQRSVQELTLADIEPVVAAMHGPISQVPPMYSAIRHQGQRLYDLARKGLEVPRAARTVEIHDLRIDGLSWPNLNLTVHCSKGTYVRSLVTDLAAALDTVAHVAALRRLSVGDFQEEQMISLDALTEAAEQGTERLDQQLLGIDTALMDRPAVTVSGTDAVALRQGRRVSVTATLGEVSVRIYEEGGEFVGLGELVPSGELKPAQIFLV